jgi:hypothetical protein
VGRCLGGAKPANPLLWSGPVSGRCTVVVVVNTGSASLRHTLNGADVGLPAGAKLTVRDLWARAERGVAQGSFAVTVAAAHDNAMLKLCPTKVKFTGLTHNSEVDPACMLD